MKLFGAARGLLDEIAVFDGHADLVAEREKQAKLGGSKAAAVGRAEEEDTENLLLGLQADADDAAESLGQSQLAEAADGLFLLVEGGEGIVAQIAEGHQAANASHQADEVVVQALSLRGAAEIVAQANRDHGSGTLGIAVMEEQRAGGKAHDTQDTIEGLREHALDFAADEARCSQVQVRQGEHVPLDAALFFFVQRHDHDRGHEGAGNRADGHQRSRWKLIRGGKQGERELQHRPGGKTDGEQTLGECLFAAALAIEDDGGGEENQSGGNGGGDAEPGEIVGHRPHEHERGGGADGRKPGLLLRVELRAEQKDQTSHRGQPLLERHLHRRDGCPLLHEAREVVQREGGPADGPKKEIRLALEGVNVDEESGHQNGGDEHAEGDESSVCHGDVMAANRHALRQ